MRSPRTFIVLSLTALLLGGLVALPASAASLHRSEAGPPSPPTPSARVAPRFEGDVPSMPTRPARRSPATAALLAVDPVVAVQACVDDPSWLCGSLKVPVDRARPRGRSLSVGFSVLPHSDPTATARDAIFVSDGGPGAANGTGKGFRVFQMAPLTDQRDLVLMDNRGTGTSGPIDCPGLQAGTVTADDTILAVAACGRQLGEDADRYGSGDVALDLEAVRRALGYPKIDYYAQSYGAVDIAGGGDPEDPAVYSEGDNAAAFCNDTDFVWDRTDPVPVRRAKFHHAERALGADAFAPFSPHAWREHFITDFCLRWPAPDRFTPAVPPGASATGFPVLLLSGDLDTQVATAITRTLRDTFPQARLLHVAGAAHPAAGWSDCARVAMRAFMLTLRTPASSTCDEPAFLAPAVPQFPQHARAAAAARPLAGDQSSALDHRIATAAVRTVLDGWLRSFRAGPTGTAPGLRGGTVAFDSTTFDDHGTLSLHRVRFSHDVTVTGEATLTYDGNLVHARARVRGPKGQTGVLTADGAFGFGAPYEAFTVTGSLGSHHVKVTVPAN